MYPAQKMYVTHVQNIGPFLKIYGQINRANGQVIEHTLEQLAPMLAGQATASPKIHEINPKEIYLVKSSSVDGSYRRCRILDANRNGIVKISLIDYGHEFEFPITQLQRMPENTLSTFPAQSIDGILCGVRNSWDVEKLDVIRNQLCNVTLAYKLEDKMDYFSLISLAFNNNQDVAETIIRQKLGIPITINEQKNQISFCLSNAAKTVSAQRIQQQQQHQLQQQQPHQQQQQHHQHHNHHSANYQHQQQQQQQQQQQRQLLPILPNHRHPKSPEYVRGLVPGRPLHAQQKQHHQPQQQQQQKTISSKQLIMNHLSANTLNNLSSQSKYFHELSNNYQPNIVNEGRQNQISQPNNYHPRLPFTAAGGGGDVAAIGGNYNQTSHQAIRKNQQPPIESQLVPIKKNQNESGHVPAFKSFTLMVGSQHKGYCAYIEDGPNLFSIHLKSSEEQLDKMMAELGDYPLKNLSQKPSLGMACVARYAEDNNLYRAVIMNIKPTTCQVAYIDYGNSANVAFKDIYEIPSSFLEHTIFAIRFTLSGYQKLQPLTQSLNKYFTTTIMEKELDLIVKPLDGPPFVQYCDLFINGENIFDKLLKMLNEFPTYKSAITIATNDMVVIRYVKSPQQFYVSKSCDSVQIDKMIDTLGSYCDKADSLTQRRVHIGMACTIKYEDDWYRAEVLEISPDKQMAHVLFVDYGFTVNSKITALKEIDPELLKMRKQAIECCLEGFKDVPNLSDLCRDQLELFAEDKSGERRIFKAVLVSNTNEIPAYINLFDDSVQPPLDVSMKMLKLSLPPKVYRQIEQQKFQQKPSSSSSSSSFHRRFDHNNGELNNDASFMRRATSCSSRKPDGGGGGGGGNGSGANETETTSNLNNKNWVELSRMQQVNDTNPSGGGDVKHQKEKSPNLLGGDNNNYQNTTMSTSDDSSITQQNNSKSSGIDDDFGYDHGNNQRSSHSKSPTPSAAVTLRTNQGGGAVSNHKHENRNSGEYSKRGSGGAAISSSGGYDRGGGVPNKSNKRDRHHYSVSNKHLIPRFNKHRGNVNPQTTTTNNPNHKDGDSSGNYSQYSENDSSELAKEPTNNVNTNVNNAITSIDPELLKPVDLNTKIDRLPITFNECVTVNVSWWISPLEFYVQLQSERENYTKMMYQIQQVYRNRPSSSTTDGQHHVPQPIKSFIISRYKDGIFYRAQIFDYNVELKKYKIQFIDVGNRCVIMDSDIWPMELRFAKLKQMAIQCSLDNIVMNYDRKEIEEKIDKYIHASKSTDCEFLSEQIDNKSAINANLIVDGISLKESLINDHIVSSLAVFVQIKRLVGQSLTITIVNIVQKDRGLFRAKLFGCETMFLCCGHRGGDDELISKREEENVPVLIERLTNDNVLIVKSLNPPTWPIYISNYPIFSDKFQMEVSHIESTNVVYVQNINHINELAQLLDNLYDSYEVKDEGKPIFDFSTTKLCAAKSSDGNWYRCVIREPPTTTSNGQVLVRYIDYGNCELVDVKMVRGLLEKFCAAIAAFALKVYLPLTCDTDATDSVMDQLSKTTKGYKLDINILDNYMDNWIMDISFNNISLVTVLKGSCRPVDIDTIRKQIARDCQQSQKQPPPPPILQKEIISNNVIIPPATTTTPALQPQPVKPPKQIKGVPAYLTHTDRPDRFYLQLATDQQELAQLNETLQIVAPSLPQLENFTEGTQCIVNYSVDECWYRAIIIDSDSEITSILFIDYGNTDTITDNNLIKEMSEAFAQIKRYAIPCALPLAVKNGTEWCDAACGILRSLLESQISFEYLSTGEQRNLVKLYHQERDIMAELILAEFGIPIPYIKNGQNVYVSHINALDDFYIQMEKDTDGLQLIEDYLLEKDKFKPLTEYSVNTICTAKFVEDDEWYRAKIVNCDDVDTNGGIEVCFIDYGNTAIATELRELPKEIAELPRLSQRCSLRMPDNTADVKTYWSEEAQQRFQELAQNGATIFKINLVLPDSNCSLVDLIHDEQNLAIELRKLSEKYTISEKDIEQRTAEISKPFAVCGSLSSINSSIDFYVQPAVRSQVLENIANELLNANDFPIKHEINIGDLCVAKFMDDSLYYRARILENIDTTNNEEGAYRIQFVDYGNQSYSKDLREMPENALHHSPLAIHCTLLSHEELSTLPFQSNSNTSLNEQEFISLIETGNEFYYFNVINTEQMPNIVRMFLDENLENEIFIKKDINNTDIVESSSLAQTDQNTTTDVNTTVVANKIVLIADDEQSQSLTADEQKDISTKDQEQQPQLEIPNIINGFISWMISSRDFYIQPSFNTDNLEIIQNYMVDDSKKLPLKATNEIGELCVAKFIDDEEFYRAKILSNNNNGCEVHFIDYGNKSIVTDIREIPEHLTNIPPLAIHCTLHETLTNNHHRSEQTSTLNHEKIIMSESEFNIMSNTVDSLYFKSVGVDDESETNVIQLFLDEKCEKEIIVVNNSSVVDECIEITNKNETNENPSVSTELVPTESIVVINDTDATTTKTTESTKENHIEEKEDLTDAECIVAEIVDITLQVAEQNLSLPSSSENDIADTEEVIADKTSTIPQPILENLITEQDNMDEIVTTIITPTKTSDPEEEESLIKDESPLVKSTTKMDNLIIALENSNENIAVIDIIQNPTSSIKTKNNKQPELFIENTNGIITSNISNGYISWINSSNDFYIQPEYNSQNLDIILSELADNELPTTKVDRNVGDLCIAKFNDDQEFYRARILTINDKGNCEVQFIDYGNKSIVDDLREMPKNLINIPSVAIHCKLPNKLTFPALSTLQHMNTSFNHEQLSSSSSLNHEQIIITESEFKTNMFINNLYYFKIIDIDQPLTTMPPSNINICQLFKDQHCELEIRVDDGEIGGRGIGVDNDIIDSNNLLNEISRTSSLSSLALSTTESLPPPQQQQQSTTPQLQVVGGYLSWSNSSIDFYVQPIFFGEQIEQTELELLKSDTFPIINNNLSINDLLYAAKFCDDNLFYRARILTTLNDGGYEVHFVDYGNKSKCYEIRELPEKLASIQPQAIHCTLLPSQATPTTTSKDDTIVAISETEFNELTGQNLYYFKLIDTIQSPNIVQIFKDENCKTEIIVTEQQQQQLLMNDILDHVNNHLVVNEDNDETIKTVGMDDNIDKNKTVGEKITQSSSNLIVNSSSIEVDGFICWALASNDFYIQPHNRSKDIEDIGEKLLSADSFERFATNTTTTNGQAVGVTIGTFGAAVFQEVYYRAKVIKVLNDNEFEVLFIDYGNVSTCKDLRVLPDDLLSISPCAMHFQLLQQQQQSLPILSSSHQQFTETQFMDHIPEYSDYICSFKLVDATTIPITVQMFKDDMEIIVIPQEQQQQPSSSPQTEYSKDRDDNNSKTTNEIVDDMNKITISSN